MKKNPALKVKKEKKWHRATETDFNKLDAAIQTIAELREPTYPLHPWEGMISIIWTPSEKRKLRSMERMLRAAQNKIVEAYRRQEKKKGR
jgi:hypothetical protein